MSTLTNRARSLQPGNLLVLYQLDMAIQGGPILYFHNGMTQGSQNIVFQANTYIPFPIQTEGYEENTKGVFPRPVLILSNIGSYITALLRAYGDLIGCVLTRKITMAEFLDGAAGADATAEFRPQIFTIERRRTETNTFVEFELATKADAEAAVVPARQIKNVCQWIYRGPDCGYTGLPKTDVYGATLTPVTNRGAYNVATTYALGDYHYTVVNGVQVFWVSLANSNTAALSDMTKWRMDVCKKQLSDCKLHFGTFNPLPFEGFPGSNKLAGR